METDKRDEKSEEKTDKAEKVEAPSRLAVSLSHDTRIFPVVCLKFMEGIARIMAKERFELLMFLSAFGRCSRQV